MARTSKGISFPLTAGALGLVLGLATVLPARGDDVSRVQAKENTVTVGKAKITWHLTPNTAVERTRLVESYEQATRARLTGTEPFVTPRTQAERTPGGLMRLPLPVELIPTMFLGADGRIFCADSMVVAKKSTVPVSDEGNE